MYSVSIIIPIYNAEKYIERCLLSVMEQIDFDGWVECILVDDCSQDESMQLAQRLIDNYKGPILFHILYNLENQGVSCSRNNGFKIAKGDFIFFLDSDDYISTNCLALLSKRLTCNGGNVDLVIGNSYDFRNNKFWQNQNETAYVLTDRTDIMRRFLQFRISMMPWNKLIRRQFLLEYNLLFAPHMIHEDELWSYELYDVVSSVVLIPEVTYHYEQNAGSIMTSQSNLGFRVEAYHSLVQKMLDTLDEKDLYVDRFFWGIHMYMLSLDIIFHNKLAPNLKKENEKLRGKLIRKSFGDGRLVIVSFLLLTILTPFNQLVRFDWFRNRYHIMTTLFKGIAMKCDRIHCRLTK